jgi:serine/threonine protein kinase
VADHTGHQFGNYRLLRRLGKGGFGQVYLGEHVYLKTHAAIKLLLEDVDDAQEAAFHAAFLQEARTIAGLKHPHILRVLEFGVETSTPYLVMEYAAHGSLLERHPRGNKVLLDHVVSYTKQIAEALQHAHEKRLIHRDVKPANVLLDEQDTVLLSDFGIATVAHRTSSMQTSAYAGTAIYMAPEQLQGKPVPASDQYALAIMVYEWLCGQPPYQGDPLAVGMQHLVAPIPSLYMQGHAFSSDISAVVRQAMAKDPRERYATVQAFAMALELAVQSEQDVPTLIKPGNSQTVVVPSDDRSVLLQYSPLPQSATFSPLFSVSEPQPTPQQHWADQKPGEAPSKSVHPSLFLRLPLASSIVAHRRSAKVFLFMALLLFIIASSIFAKMALSPNLSPSQSYIQATDHSPVFVDPLKDNSNGYDWPEGDYVAYGSCFFKEGAYHVTAEPGAIHACVTRFFPILQDFAFQGEVLVVSGTAGGFTFRFAPPNHGFFSILLEMEHIRW